MCDIEKICGESNTEDCIDKYYTALRDEIALFYEHKNASFSLIIEEINLVLDDAKFEDVHNELDKIRKAIRTIENKSFDSIDFGMAILMAFPSTFVFGFASRVLKTSLKRVFIAAKKKSGGGLSPLSSLIKQADNKFTDVALAVNFPELYDETISYGKKTFESEFEKASSKGFKDATKVVGDILNETSDNLGVLPYYESISEYQLNFLEKKKNFSFQNSTEKNLRFNSLTELKRNYKNDDLVCFFHQEYWEQKQLNRTEFSIVTDIATLVSLIVFSFSKNVFFTHNDITSGFENYTDFNTLEESAKKDERSRYTDSPYFEGTLPTIENTESRYSPARGPSQVYGKGSASLMTNTSKPIPDIMQKSPLASQLGALLYKKLNSIITVNGTQTTILKNLNLTFVEFLLKAYDSKGIFLKQD